MLFSAFYPIFELIGITRLVVSGKKTVFLVFCVKMDKNWEIYAFFKTVWSYNAFLYFLSHFMIFWNLTLVVLGKKNAKKNSFL